MKRIRQFVALGSILFATSAQANVTVNSLNDHGSGSLRQAIADTLPGDTINVAVAGTIALTSGELVVSNNISILGPGAANLIISGANTNRVFNIRPGVIVSISALTIRDGRGDQYIWGGGLYNAGTLTLSNCVVSGNSGGDGEPSEDGGPGGAIYNNGNLQMRNCTLGNNAAGNGGGGNSQGGGGDGGSGGCVFNAGTLSMIGCSLRTNSAGTGGAYGFYYQRGGAGGLGGGIYNVAVMTMDHCAIDDNAAGKGGRAGLDANIIHGNGGGLYNLGMVTLSDCTVSGNTAGGGNASTYGGSGGAGGGLYNTGPGTLNLFRCVVSANSAGDGAVKLDGGVGGSWGGSGGGVYNDGTVTLSECSVNDNFGGTGTSGCFLDCSGGHGGSGGGFYNTGVLTLTNCTLSGNHGGGAGLAALGGTGGEGGGVYNTGTLLLAYCALSGNHGGDGASGERWGGAGGNGGGVFNSGILRLADCTLSGNHGGDGAKGRYSGGSGGSGGGVFNTAILTMINCTVSGNATGQGGPVTGIIEDPVVGGGDGGSGGGLCNTGTLTLTNCTISANSTGSGGAGLQPKPDGRPGSGGGIWNGNSGIAELLNTIVANDQALGGGPDVFGNFVSLGHNLIGNTNNSSGEVASDVLNVDPLLGPLQDNGGPTFTHALLPGSPAIDAGQSSGLATDQRGMSRSVDDPMVPNAVGGDGTDIGAFELQTVDTPVQALNRLISMVAAQAAGPQPLKATLNATLASLNRGNFKAALNELQAFQNKVRAQVAPSDPALAASFIKAAKEIIDVLSGGRANRGGQAHGRIAAVTLRAGGPVQLRLDGVTASPVLIEASTNLVNWKIIGVGVQQPDGSYNFEDCQAAGCPSRYYRIHR